jgi:hypothetical protein
MKILMFAPFSERKHFMDQSRGGPDIALPKATVLEIRGLAMEPPGPHGPAPFERRLQRNVLKRSVLRRRGLRECLNDFISLQTIRGIARKTSSGSTSIPSTITMSSTRPT